ncbi:hypothetical protein GCM10023187_04490 [Nibrella viscosa]|uniref:VWFA domain-containing protein n=1 Tax=Nibrella viscosa TaxID=1084524 RepID=A0ABP8JUW0_9BACT
MSEQNDNELHNWVRRTLHEYRPDPDPQGWAQMQRKLQRRRWWRWSAVGGLLLVLVGIGWWFRQDMPEPNARPLSGAVLPQRPGPAPTSGPLEESALVANAGEQHEADTRPLPVAKKVSIAGKKVELDDMKPAAPTLTLQPMLPRLPGPRSRPLRLPEVLFDATYETIKQQVLTGTIGADSTTYNVLSRNAARWPDAVLVCDFTTSMYPYSTQLFAWFRQNARNRSINGMVFFTDCDSLGQETRPNGPAGQMFVNRERDPAKALPVLLDAARNTINNVDENENDIAALLFAQQTFPNAKHLILLGDNASGVKDMALLNRVTKPVHVVLCGSTGDSALAFQPDYYTIARQTGGTLHAIADDLDPRQIAPDTWLQIGHRYYRYHARRNQFVLTRFRLRPILVLGLFWL